MHLLCPHCRNPIEVSSLDPSGAVSCPACGSTFQIETGSTRGWLPQAGQTIGRFTLLESVGTGAFGTVFKARDSQLDRLVAVKIPRAGNLAGAPEVDRFQREARSVAQLRHEGIVAVHEVGIHEGVPFLVSEFVEGVTLADFLSAGPPGWRDTAEIVRRLAEALAYAHSRGVVHRDVKPSNVMLERHASATGAELRPRLMDFGMAKRDVGDVTMTMEGQVLGTPAYMAPEQARGDAHRVDGRSDIYSLGVLLYQMLSGELPFRGTARMLLHQVIHDDPRPPRRLNDRIPRDLETICLKAMAKEPARRYATAEDLAADLQRWLTGMPILARPMGQLERAWRWSQRNRGMAITGAAAIMATGAALVILTILTIVRTNSVRNLNHERKNTREALEAVAAVSRAQAYQLAENHHDHGQALCERGEVGQGLMWMARALETAPPDASDLQTAIRMGIAAWRARHSPIDMMFPHGSRPFTAEFSPDGTLAASGGFDGTVRVWEVASGRSQYPALQQGARLNCLGFSPDGTRLASGDWSGVVQVWDVSTGHPVVPPLRLGGEMIWSVRFSPDGKTLIVADSLGQLQFWSPVTGQAVSSPWKLEDGPCVALSRNGRFAVTGQTGQPYRIYEIESRKMVGKVTATVSTPMPPEISNDGKNLWSGDFGGKARGYDVASGSEIVTIATGRRMLGAIALTRDGRRLLTGSMHARLWDATTGEPLGPAVRHNSFIQNAVAIHPDGTTVVTGSGNRDLYLWKAMRPDSDRASISFPDEYWRVRLSQDGRRIFTSMLNGTVTVWDAQSREIIGKPMHHSSRVSLLFPTPDGKTLITGSNTHLHHWDLATFSETRTPIARTTQFQWNRGALTSDGAAFWFSDYSSPSGCAYCVDVREWTQRPIKLTHPVDVEALAVSGDGQYVATGSHDGLPRLWKADGTLVATLEARTHRFNSLVFRPDGKSLIVTNQDGTARLYHVPSGQPYGSIMNHGDGILDSAFSPDGRVAATAGHGGSIRIWDAHDGRSLGQCLRSGSWVRVGFSPDGQFLYGILDSSEESEQMQLWIWHAATRRPLGPPVTVAGRIVDVRSTDQAIAFATFDGVTRKSLFVSQRYPATTEESVEVLHRQVELDTGMAFDHADILRPLTGEEWHQRRGK